MLSIQQALAQLGNQPHAGGRKLRTAAASAPPLIRTVIQRQRHIAAQNHRVAIASGKLDKNILSSNRIIGSWRNHSIGHAIKPRHGDQLRFGMEGVGNMHVRHDLIRWLRQVIAHGIGSDLRQSKRRIGIDETWINSQAVRIDNRRVLRHSNAPCRANRSDFAVNNQQHTVLDRSMADGE